MPRLCIPFLFFLLLCTNDSAILYAQSRYPLIITAGTHALTVPWYPKPVKYRFNPAFSAGSERTLKAGGSMRYYQTVNFGFFRHYWWMTGFFGNTELGVSRTLPFGFHTDLRLGFGTIHYFWRRETLELKNGKYVSATDWGRPSIMIPISFVFGYRGYSSHPLAVSPFVSLQWIIQTPFIDEIPAMTHFLVNIGVRFNRGRVKPGIGR